ncbi:MAG TPA: 4Fe-4S dicluster domain-containing protein [Desulfobulbus sp.]|nr:4Fe-4S dicluster domain-containing protein [Desulfobulbus sp.]
MKQYAMIINLERCVGCHACAVACRAEWQIPTREGYRRNWVRRLGPAMTSHGMSHTFYPGLCNHCDSPACIPVCPADRVEKTFTDPSGKTKTMEVAATWKDPFNGTVQIDQKRCLGCGACRDACPYGARYVNTQVANEDIDGEGIADKCTFCMPRVEKGLAPACVQTCITDARIFGFLDDPGSEVAAYVKKGARRLESANVKIGPNVYYYGKPRDLELLAKTSTPQVMPEVSSRRRMLAAIMQPAVRQVRTAGLLGLAGALAVQGLAEDGEKEE